MTRALPHIAAMSPYALADMTAPDWLDLVSLSQNESLRGPSPAVVEAAKSALSDGAFYPDPDWTSLRAALAHQHGIAMEGILCGAGSLDLIGCLARVFSGPDRAILAPAHAYPFFRTAAQMANARFDTAPEQNETVCVDAVLKAVARDTSIVFLANPGNPTGTHIAKSDLSRLRAELRADILLVIDEAYGEFIDARTERCWDLVDKGNCVVLRTFSKAYAMAGFRVGWGLFPTTVATELRKVMNPNGNTGVSQAAAVAAITDQTYMIETCEATTALRDDTADRLREVGFDIVPSVTNFVLVRFETTEAAYSADAALRAKGIFLRRQQGAGLPHALRMTIGPTSDNERAIACLTKWQRETTT